MKKVCQRLKRGRRGKDWVAALLFERTAAGVLAKIDGVRGR
jgi:hypothetical protein